MVPGSERSKVKIYYKVMPLDSCCLCLCCLCHWRSPAWKFNWSISCNTCFCLVFVNIEVCFVCVVLAVQHNLDKGTLKKKQKNSFCIREFFFKLFKVSDFKDFLKWHLRVQVTRMCSSVSYEYALRANALVLTAWLWRELCLSCNQEGSASETFFFLREPT